MGTTASRLADYVRKRDFSRTGEPRGASRRGKSARPAFVVQKHDATRLHYDFRLEWKGVLLSWAVTRGPSTDPGAKRLAVRTEDHPTDYGDFEGTIPAGQYGGGTVMLWDTGWWEPQEDFAKGLEDGKLKFILHGERMNGGWTLVRMRTEEKRENWLLIKERDDRAEDNEDALTRRYSKSVKTGRTMKQIADGKAPAQRTVKKEKPAPAPRKRKFTLATPKFSKPQLARLADDAPQGDDWLHETKFDGYRCLAAVGKDGVRLYTRSGLDWSDRYAGLPEAFGQLDCKSALIDGEVVSASAPRGSSSFSALQRDLEQQRPVRFAAFDLLECDGQSLRQKPLVDRKERLKALLSYLPNGSPILYSEHVRGNGRKVFEAISKAGGEGIVSKAVDSTYSGSRSGKWLKIKARRRQEFIVGGYSPSSARGRPFSSLLVGTLEDGKLRYRGRVGGGLSGDALDHLSSELKKRSRKTSPFNDVPRDVARTAHWVTPALVVEVEYAEMTDQGVIRHGVYQGVREDKEAGMVHLEKPLKKDGEDKEGGSGEVLGIRISHPERVVFPDAGCTKLDVARYYEAMGGRMLELAGNRPVSLIRCPDGADGECFFQKHAGKGFPSAIDSVDIEESSGKTAAYMVLKRHEAFVAAVQMSTIEFHIWGSRADNIEKPDRVVFDLDPDEGTDFADVRAAAREMREMLQDIGLESVPMLTGGKGIHVIVPLRRIATWKTVTFFAKTVANHMADRDPDRYVATMSKAKRKDKIFIDWLRNDRGQTAVAPYSIRARAGAPVAVPVTWSELSRLKAANTFDMKKAAGRLSKDCPLVSFDRDQSISKEVVQALEDRLRT